MSELIEIYIELLEEGSAAARGTKAMPLGNGLYKVLATPDYDPEDEVWEFPPGSVVSVKNIKTADNEKILLAVSSDAVVKKKFNTSKKKLKKRWFL